MKRNIELVAAVVLPVILLDWTNKIAANQLWLFVVNIPLAVIAIVLLFWSREWYQLSFLSKRMNSINWHSQLFLVLVALGSSILNVLKIVAEQST